ncbi:uncharacterized protein LOC120285977 isoform X1 [Eucalyptus grandis]|uniref:uncharacterized protein LOC120285977 isoform X1 n=2 Tax=Eucalyptus grandis TaxID=71139 RepID=UPI00192EE892|nr:uncharacterized protein LOC120285977 isoform X1 [Eucalyptus grandis]XP_039171282.1 uncharacterized protein LOC120285977 isoform X1 [Eucalyptus grandis]
MTLSPNQFKEAVEPLYVLLAAKRCVQIDSVEKDPVILDLQDVHSTTGPLGTGIAEQSTMQREVIEFSMSGLSCVEKAGLDMSLVSDLTGLHSVETDMHRLPIIPSLVYPNFQFSTQSPLSDFMGDLVRNSKITINSDGRVLITASGAEMKDLLSIVAEFYLLRNLTQGRKLSMPVPYFRRHDNNHLICLETAKEEVDKIMVTDAPLLFPPGQLALAALRHANEVHRVLDYERYLENMLIRQNSIHSSTELIQHLNAIDSSVRTYKFPSEKDMKHINRKLRSCWGLSSHDDSNKRDKKSKHKSKRSAGVCTAEASSLVPHSSKYASTATMVAELTLQSLFCITKVFHSMEVTENSGHLAA